MQVVPRLQNVFKSTNSKLPIQISKKHQTIIFPKTLGLRPKKINGLSHVPWQFQNAMRYFILFYILFFTVAMLKR
jgi:hypothetical protein